VAKNTQKRDREENDWRGIVFHTANDKFSVEGYHIFFPTLIAAANFRDKVEKGKIAA
jgi:hypothetical protein